MSSEKQSRGSCAPKCAPTGGLVRADWTTIGHSGLRHSTWSAGLPHVPRDRTRVIQTAARSHVGARSGAEEDPFSMPVEVFASGEVCACREQECLSNWWLSVVLLGQRIGPDGFSKWLG